MKRTLWISAIALALLSLTCFSFAQGVVPTTNAGTPVATAFGASLAVGLTVTPYASVAWGGQAGTGTPGVMALKLCAPISTNSGWGAEGTNWDYANLTLKSNCDVNLTFTEGLSSWVAAQTSGGTKIPAQCCWGQGAAGGVWPTVFTQAVQPIVPGHLYTVGGVPAQPMGQIFCNPGDQGTTLPDSSGLGGTASAVFKYGWYAGDASNSPTQTPAGTCVLYAGTCVIPVGIGLMETTKTYTDGAGRVWDWTCLPATATGTAHVWAMISAP